MMFVVIRFAVRNTLVHLRLREPDVAVRQCCFRASQLRDCPVEHVSYKILLLWLLSCRKRLLVASWYYWTECGQNTVFANNSFKQHRSHSISQLSLSICAAKIIKNAPSTVFHHYSFQIDNAMSADVTILVFADTLRPRSSSASHFPKMLQNILSNTPQVDFGCQFEAGSLVGCDDCGSRRTLSTPSTNIKMNKVSVKTSCSTDLASSTVRPTGWSVTLTP